VDEVLRQVGILKKTPSRQKKPKMSRGKIRVRRTRREKHSLFKRLSAKRKGAETGAELPKGEPVFRHHIMEILRYQHTVAKKARADVRQRVKSKQTIWGEIGRKNRTPGITGGTGKRRAG